MYLAPGEIQVTKQDKGVAQILSATFPEYKGQKIKVVPSTRPVHTESYWSGGSRSYFTALNLSTMQTLPVPQNGTPFDGGSLAPNGVVVPIGFAIVEHVIFCGKDLGIRIHVHPDTITKFLKES